jgi:hypothetical protein
VLSSIDLRSRDCRDSNAATKVGIKILSVKVLIAMLNCDAGPANAAQLTVSQHRICSF